mmetsp:Transcript_26056/g.72705  ORF Transcript_26056/g.72705 Transcript_26056/m.72705 type:complete len:218 (-) Transcript_26056:868-1521(-)
MHGGFDGDVGLFSMRVVIAAVVLAVGRSRIRLTGLGVLAGRGSRRVHGTHILLDGGFTATAETNGRAKECIRPILVVISMMMIRSPVPLHLDVHCVVLVRLPSVAHGVLLHRTQPVSFVHDTRHSSTKIVSQFVRRLMVDGNHLPVVGIHPPAESVPFLHPLPLRSKGIGWLPALQRRLLAAVNESSGDRGRLLFIVMLFESAGRVACLGIVVVVAI